MATRVRLFEYLKRVVCSITGKDIEQLLEEEVLVPLNLKHMEFKFSSRLEENAAIGHIGADPTYWNIPTEPGMASTMHTEARAFSKICLSYPASERIEPIYLSGNEANTHKIPQRMVE